MRKIPRASRCSTGARRRRHGQGNTDAKTAIVRGLNADFRLMQFRDGARQRQAQPIARTRAAGFAAIEGLEQPGMFFPRYARSIVPDADNGMILSGLERDFYFRACR